MTFEELLTADNNAPVKCADGKFGLLIRWWQSDQTAGIQVHGEEQIRAIPASRLSFVGDGAMVGTAVDRKGVE